MMDFLQQWGIYAPLLIYIWLALAVGIAYLRTRPRNRLIWPLLYGEWIFLSWLPISSNSWRTDQIDASWWRLYGLYALLPLGLLGLQISGLHRIQGYRHPIDVLLFRAPTGAS